MKSTIKIALIIIFLSFITSCQKREEKTFTVKVYNPVTGEPYSDIYVAVLERPNTTDGYVTESTTFLEGYTNASGELRLTGEFHVRYAYDLITSTPGGVTICNTESRHNDLKSSVILHLDDENLEGSEAYVELTPCASLKLDIQNISCVDNNDHIIFDTNPIDNNGKNVYSPVDEFGCYQSQFGFDQVQSGEWKAEWEVIKNGVTNYYDSIFFVPENSQYTFQVNY